MGEGKLRNKPCKCGSGKKYKYCCYYKGSSQKIRNKIMLLFGAGASNGACGIDTPPPLGKDLYGELAERFSDTWGKLDSVFQNKFKENFEDGMDLLENHEPKFPLLKFVKEMGIFFSRYRIDDVSKNLYCQIINRYLNGLRSNELIIVTTNYDCLIELALRHIDKTITEDWKNNGGIKILKIHGSCNYLPIEQARVIGKGEILLGKEAKVITELEYVDPKEVEYKIRNSKFAPAMSLYARGKRVLVGGKQIQAMLEEFQNYSRNINLVVVIGLYPNPSDIHIWDYLRDAPGKLLLINKGKEGCEKWGRDNRPEGEKVWFKDTFLSAMEDGNLYELIDAALKRTGDIF